MDGSRGAKYGWRFRSTDSQALCPIMSMLATPWSRRVCGEGVGKGCDETLRTKAEVQSVIGSSRQRTTGAALSWPCWGTPWSWYMCGEGGNGVGNSGRVSEHDHDTHHTSPHPFSCAIRQEVHTAPHLDFLQIGAFRRDVAEAVQQRAAGQPDMFILRLKSVGARSVGRSVGLERQERQEQMDNAPFGGGKPGCLGCMVGWAWPRHAA